LISDKRVACYISKPLFVFKENHPILFNIQDPSSNAQFVAVPVDVGAVLKEKALGSGLWMHRAENSKFACLKRTVPPFRSPEEEVRFGRTGILGFMVL
jgi:hypothetical protein